ncbi:MAG: hypothetical protein KF819_30240 [Labilithrix sp.]|nr:hypothetical protein [Labilithrix sp.]
MRRAAGWIASVAVAAAFVSSAAAQAPSTSPASPDDAGDAGVGAEIGGCVESIPKGAARPFVNETFPARGTSGWAATLSITVVHGKGERVLPAGLDLGAAAEAKKYLQKAGFVIPDQDGGAAAHISTEPDDKSRSQATTHLELPLVVLPPEPGRSVLTLPPLPVAIARANGEIATVCTHPHTIVVEDPIANVPQAEPKPNPEPRPQREEWTALKKAVLYGGLGLVVGALLAYLGYKWWNKPKPPVPPPPPRPPWEVALEQLDEVRHAGLLDAKRHTEYFDRVSDAVRGYLGARFGFDGLESTSDEILTALEKQAAGFVRLDTGSEIAAPAPGVPLEEVRRFLAECDLVKFANLKPSPEQCATALIVGEHIVRATMPFASPASPPSTRPETKEGA